VPKAVVQARYERLLTLQEEISWAENRAQEGRVLDVLVAEGEGRKDGATRRLSGRARDNRLVHLAVPRGAEQPRPGDVAEVQVSHGAPHHLVADGGLAGGHYAVRRTRAGDAWQRRAEAATSATSAAAVRGVALGIPTLRGGAPG
jgi:tRNA-2-methylthio-N6-dimethylallyladenosine synthase